MFSEAPSGHIEKVINLRCEFNSTEVQTITMHPDNVEVSDANFVFLILLTISSNSLRTLLSY